MRKQTASLEVKHATACQELEAATQRAEKAEARRAELLKLVEEVMCRFNRQKLILLIVPLDIVQMLAKQRISLQHKHHASNLPKLVIHRIV